MAEKRKTYTSAAVKNRYAAKNYDRINLFVKKGQRDAIKQRAEALGMSLNEYITGRVRSDMGISNDN